MFKTQRLRRLTQVAVFIGMFVVPLLNLFEIYFIKGTFISLDIGSLAIADPVMIFQAMFAGATFSGVLAVSIVIPVLLMVFLGRVWCSWICPYNLIVDLAEKVPGVKGMMRKNRTKAAEVEKRTTRTTIYRYLILLSFMVLVGISSVPILHLFSPPSVISTQALLVVKSAVITIEILFVVVLLIVEVFFAYRFGCRYLCPTGTCLSLFKSKYGLRVEYAGECLDCGACSRACPMLLDPRFESRNRLCYNCGKCISVCADQSNPLYWRAG